MSRPQSRQLSLTEELEKLEQSITLTLQEIDHNFSRAHRIVTTSILPIVEQYADHSKAVWEGSKFWKQFFEASANVSLSGYEEAAPEEEEEDVTSYTQSQDNTYTNLEHGEESHHQRQEQQGQQTSYDDANESLMEDTDDISGSTPRPPQMQSAIKPRFASFDSPYESLKYELKGGKKPSMQGPDDYEEELTADLSLDPETPAKKSRQPPSRDMSMTPLSSPFEPTTNLGDNGPVPPSTSKAKRPQPQHKSTDPLLHRVLDKTYRLQATPHNVPTLPSHRNNDSSPSRNAPASKQSAWQDSSPMSSPPSIAPQLRSEIFTSPIRNTRNTTHQPPRTPGVSVQTPAKARAYSGKYAHEESMANGDDEIGWDSDDDDVNDVYKELGMSPPKTIQFALGPSRLLQTPAQEASKRIVEDILNTAGGAYDVDVDDSPSIVRMSSNLDDSF